MYELEFMTDDCRVAKCCKTSTRNLGTQPLSCIFLLKKRVGSWTNSNKFEMPSLQHLYSPFFKLKFLAKLAKAGIRQGMHVCVLLQSWSLSFTCTSK